MSAIALAILSIQSFHVLAATPVADGCSDAVGRLGKAINLHQDEYAQSVKTGKSDPGGDDFYFSGGSKGGATYPVREVLGPELAEQPIIGLRETGHGYLYYKGYRFDGVPYLTGPKMGRPFVTQGRGLSDGGLAIVLKDLPQEVLTKLETSLKNLAASGPNPVAGAVTSFSCIKAVCNVLDDAGLKVLGNATFKEKSFPPEFLDFLVNKGISTKAGDKVTMQFFRLNDVSSPDIFKNINSSTAGFIKAGKIAGAGLGVIVTGATGTAVWLMSDDEQAPSPDTDKLSEKEPKEK